MPVAVLALKHLPLGLRMGITQLETHQEAVQLRLWQGIGTGLVDRVLGGNDEERVGQRDASPPPP